MEILLNEKICVPIFCILVLIGNLGIIIFLALEKEIMATIFGISVTLLWLSVAFTVEDVYEYGQEQEQKIYDEERQEAQKLLEERQKQEEGIFNKKLETYKFMIDGREVDREDIDISLYNLVINDEKETIFMTGK